MSKSPDMICVCVLCEAFQNGGGYGPTAGLFTASKGGNVSDHTCYKNTWNLIIYNG